MTPIRSRNLRLLTAAAVLAAGWGSSASADCRRRVYNRSAYVLVASQDGGPSLVIGPGRSVPVRLTRPGRLDLTAYCPPADRFGRPVAGGREAAQIQLAYEAVLDRCYVKIGDGLFEPELGPGFIGTQDTAPFAVNTPNPGDIVLGPVRDRCLPGG